jgi:hypothetical protein
MQFAARRQPDERACQHRLPTRHHRQAAGHEDPRKSRQAEPQRRIEGHRIGIGRLDVAARALALDGAPRGIEHVDRHVDAKKCTSG